MISFFERLIKETEYTTRETTWSPRCSSAGICAGSEIPGAGCLYFHYNRFTRSVFNRFIAFDLPLDKNKTTVLSLNWGNSTALYCAGANSFVFESDELNSVTLFSEPTAYTKDFTLFSGDEKGRFYRGYTLTDERRDPDRETPFAVSVRLACGHFGENNTVIAENGKIKLSLAIRILTVDEDEMCAQTDNPLKKTADELLTESAVGWRKIAENFGGSHTEREAEMLSRAIRTLVFNTTMGEGKLQRYLSCYPNRGEYPTHYLWDTYFQNLGYRHINPRACVEFLLQIAVNIRPDGKLPQFMCSTWDRPEDSQAPLLGWAVLNILDLITDRNELAVLYDALCRNTRWWMTARITPCGLIYSPSGLETGQDNAPRFDGGATIPCDMNAYLLNQMHSTAVIADKLGDDDGKAYYKKLASDFSDKIYKNLYCRDDGLFYDVSRENGGFVRVRSNACALPVWAGVKMPDAEKKFIIEEFLLNPSAMNGAIPFPSVAYDDEKYDGADWWRGPTWMPIARLLLETLTDNGYNEDAAAIRERLYEMMIKDGCLHELFNSQTGEGEGARQQGWTAGVFVEVNSACRVLGVC